jgi:DNA repair protein RadC
MEQLLNLDALTTVAEVELIYKSIVKPSERPLVNNSSKSYQLLLQTWDENKIDFVEQFKVLLLNRSNRVLGIYELSSGGITGTVADVRLIMTAALKANSVAIILSHNHPSGNLMPSRADIEHTAKIKEAGKYLDIQVLDHIILTSEGYYSFADEGAL